MTNEQIDADFLRELAHYTSTLSHENEARVRRIADLLDTFALEPSALHRGHEIPSHLAQQAWYHVQQEAVVNGALPLKDAIVNIWTRITGLPQDLAMQALADQAQALDIGY